MRWSGFCCLWYQVLLHSPSVLRHLSSAGLSPTHWLALGWGAMDLFFSPSLFSQWQPAEVLWGLDANELTLQRWGRCSGTQGVGESEDSVIRDAVGCRQSRPCCRDVTKWDVRLQSRPFSQSGPIIQHVTKYLVNSVCLNFQETKPKGSRARDQRTRAATVEWWDALLHVSQRGRAGPSFNVSYLHFTFFFAHSFVVLHHELDLWAEGSLNCVFTWRPSRVLSASRWIYYMMWSTCPHGVIMCWSPLTPCEPQWSEKNLTSFLGLRCSNYYIHMDIM